MNAHHIPRTAPICARGEHLLAANEPDSDELTAQDLAEIDAGKDFDRPSLDRFVNNNADRREGTR